MIATHFLKISEIIFQAYFNGGVINIFSLKQHKNSVAITDYAIFVYDKSTALRQFAPFKSYSVITPPITHVPFHSVKANADYQQQSAKHLTVYC